MSKEAHHPFVATPRNGPCSSCSKPHGAAVHRQPERAKHAELGFKCQECGKKFKTTAAAERATSEGCPKCGGCDIDVDVNSD